MPKKSLAVTLDMSTAPPSVQIDDAELDPGVLPQFINWHLEGNAAGGKYVSFKWRREKPPKGFSAFAPILATKFALMGDVHTGTVTKGNFFYDLVISVGRTTYRTRRKASGSGTPNIKNK